MTVSREIGVYSEKEASCVIIGVYARRQCRRLAKKAVAILFSEMARS